MERCTVQVWADALRRANLEDLIVDLASADFRMSVTTNTLGLSRWVSEVEF